MKTNVIHNTDCLTGLKELPDNSIDCIVTSPPYWALRDYGVEGQLGLENTFQDYIDKLLEIFTECKRVLKENGSCWINLGDTYSGSNGRIKKEVYLNNTGHGAGKTDLQDKSLCMIPERFAIAMIESGWILRNQIIWHKPSCMPSSVKDRFTVDFEKVFFLLKTRSIILNSNLNRTRQKTLNMK
jgi:DNA modification methylase